MKIIWVRGAEEIVSSKPLTDFVVSPIRGGGKSSLLEHRAESYLRHGNTVIDFFGCTSSDTEILTVNGWKPFRDISKSNLVATINMWDQVEYQKPSAVQEYSYEGDMIRIGNHETPHSLLVTPDHRLLLEHVNGCRCIRRAHELLEDSKMDSKYTPWLLLQGSGERLWKIPIKQEHVKREHYSGKIYDVTVPNSTIYIRNEGEPVWSGNSRDGEGLAWCRHPQVVSGEKKIALLHSGNLTVTSSYDTIPINALKQKHLTDYDILVSASPLHSGLEDEYRNINYITDLLYDRGAKGYEKLVVGIVREASSLYFSRIRVDRNQTSAKAYMIYLIREARHMGLALELDTLKMTSIDIDIRILCDYTYFKGQGYLGLPDDLTFLYGYFYPAFIRNMAPHEFIILSRKGNIGLGVFPEVKWHKQERENLLKLLDIRVEPHEGIIPSVDLGHYKTVGDKEHLQMVEAVAPKKLRELRSLGSERKSYRGIAQELKVSPSTVTVHVARHDDAVAVHGYCPVCRRSGGLLYQDRIKARGEQENG